MMKVRNLCFVFASIAMASPAAFAHGTYLDAAELLYPNIVMTPLDSCSMCHSSGFNRNSYGNDFAANSHSFAAIEGLDSDNDGIDNVTEIDLLTFPGNATSCPLKVLKPTSGQTWTLGTKVPVTWTTTGDVGTDVTIELWQNGHKVKTLKGVTPNDGTQKVLPTATLPTGTGFRVRVISVTNTAVANFSPGTITIVPAVP